MQALERLHQEGGFLQIKLCDGLSSVDFNDYGDGVRFFIEQYYDVIYGGFYDLAAAREILNAIFNGMTSDGLRDFFPTLPGELLYEYMEGADMKSCDANAISPLCRNALRFNDCIEG